MKVRDTQVVGEFGAQNPYIEGTLNIKYYLDGADITSNVKQDGDYPTTLYCFYYKTENDGKLNIKYYYRSANGTLQEKTDYSYNLVLPGTKLKNITPGTISEWTYKLNDREVSGTFYYNGTTNDTVEVYLETDPDSSLKITVSTSDKTIATNKYIYDLCTYADTSTYSLSTSGNYVEKKCPTKSHILANNGGQLINIPSSYSDNQCVKESDLSLKSRTINFIIRNSTGYNMNETTISMYENGSSTKTHSVTWPSSNNNASGDVSNSYTINPGDFSKFNSSLKFKWDGTYWVNKKLKCQFDNGSLLKNIKVDGEDSLNHMTGSVNFEIKEKLDYFIRTSNNIANIIFIISQA